MQEYNISYGKRFKIMKNCELVTMVSVLACTIAKGKTKEELGILAAIFTQLRRYFNNINCIRDR